MVALASVRAHWLDDAPSVVVSAAWLKEFGFEMERRSLLRLRKGLSL